MAGASEVIVSPHEHRHLTRNGKKMWEIRYEFDLELDVNWMGELAWGYGHTFDYVYEVVQGLRKLEDQLGDSEGIVGLTGVHVEHNRDRPDGPRVILTVYALIDDMEWTPHDLIGQIREVLLSQKRSVTSLFERSL
ncbi:hypothetical protein [Haloechinothrix salitolerans]|uniref:Uncharacterized protein n=1 Tax=Haloechinothrix salitolerans TaxID=926830 RepID=A0ABW2C9F0_9PSEU